MNRHLNKHQQEMEKLAEMVSWKCLQRYPWVDRLDMVQEAWIRLLELSSSFDPSFGVPFGAYAWPILIRQMFTQVVYDSAPVSSPKDTFTDLMDCWNVPAGEGEEDPEDEDDKWRVTLSHNLTAAKIAYARQRAREVHRIIRQHAPRPHLAWDVIVEEYKSGEVAERHDIDVKHVYNSTYIARTAVEEHFPKEMREAWE